MRTKTFLTTAGVLLFSAVSLAAAPAARPWLYMLNAQSGELVSSGGGYELVLRRVAPETIVFTDERAENVTAVPTDRFIENWKSMQAEMRQGTPVVAALDPVSEPAGEAIGLELSDPVYVAEAGEIRYKARPLQSAPAGDRSFGTSTLFLEAGGQAVPPPAGAEV